MRLTTALIAVALLLPACAEELADFPEDLTADCSVSDDLRYDADDVGSGGGSVGQPGYDPCRAADCLYPDRTAGYVDPAPEVSK